MIRRSHMRINFQRAMQHQPASLELPQGASKIQEMLGQMLGAAANAGSSWLVAVNDGKWMPSKWLTDGYLMVN